MAASEIKQPESLRSSRKQRKSASYHVHVAYVKLQSAGLVLFDVESQT